MDHQPYINTKGYKDIQQIRRMMWMFYRTMFFIATYAPSKLVIITYEM